MTRARTLGLCAAAIAAAVGCAFLPSLSNGFVDWDDSSFLLQNFNWRGLSPAELRWAFTTFTSAHYQPLTWLSLGLDFALWGLDPRGYHLTSLLLHALTTAVAFLVFRRLLRAARPEGGDGPAALAGALFAALAFGLHPLRVESVAWVSERRDALSGLFYLGAVLLYLRAQRAGEADGPRRGLGGSLALYAASLLSKVVGLTLPGTLLILDLYPLRRKPTRALLLEKAPYLLLALAMAAVNLAAQSASQGVASLASHAPARRLASVAWSLAFYLGKTLLPTGLSPLYEAPRPFVPWAPQFLAAAALVLALTAAAWLLRRRFPALAAAWAAYALALLPMSGLLLTGPQLAADRYSYIPCLAWAALAGGLLRTALEAPSAAARRGAGAAAVCAVLTLGALSGRQTRVWHDTRSLWVHALRIQPRHAMGLLFSGIAAQEDGRLDDAQRLMRASLDENPAYHEAWIRLGEVLEAQGRPEDARAAYQDALERRPDSAEAQFKLGRLLSAAGEEEKGGAMMKAAMGRSPRFALPGNGDKPDTPERMAALREMEVSVRISPRDPVLRNRYGNLLTDAGRPRQAIAQFEAAALLLPRSAPLAFNTGNALMLLGEMARAKERYETALRLDPGFVGARQNLSVVAAALEDPGEKGVRRLSQ
ncbi:MAG: tetratricopeptide repeat protein [Elusimicrobia bacterium]|nr:tetratricopeptide repeat protein [Elusimicrobiota bacterium]